MISQVQNTDPLALASQVTNPRASELYTQGSSFHDLFTSAVATPTAPAAAAPTPTISQLVAKMVTPPVTQTTSQTTTQTAAPVAAAVQQPPMPVPAFEQNAVVTSPDGSTTPLNSIEMASASTAALMAAKLGGTVVADQFGGGFSTSADIREISFTNSTVKINAGLAASLFANYGDAPGSQAWRIINSGLGLDPMSTGTNT